MKSIVLRHYPSADDVVINTAINVFYQLRNLGLERAPSTRELLHWLKYIQQYAKDESLEKIKSLFGIGSLVKTQADLEKVQSKLFKSGSKDYIRRSRPN